MDEARDRAIKQEKPSANGAEGKKRRVDLPASDSEDDDDASDGGAAGMMCNVFHSDADASYILDTGATKHYTGNLAQLINLRPVNECVRLPNNATERISHIGDLVLRSLVPHDGRYVPQEAVIENVHYGLTLGANLISQGTLQDAGYLVESDARHTTVYRMTPSGTPHVLLVTRRAKGDLPRVMLDRDSPTPSGRALALLAAQPTPTHAQQVNLIGKARDTFDNWHRRARHANFRLVKLAAAHGKNLELLTKGPIVPLSYHKKVYICTYISRKYTFARAIKNKNEAGQMFEEVYRTIRRTFNAPPKAIMSLKTDGGGEYVVADAFCTRKGIQRQKTNPHKSVSNNPEV